MVYVLLLAALIFGCSSGEKGALDALELGHDAEHQVLDELALDDGQDNPDLETSQCVPASPGRLTPPTPNPRKFALAVFHFNIQYVAGGIKGMVPEDPQGMFDYDNDALEDRIVKESFEPLLDIFIGHPSFAADIEMQGYMLDVLMDRHPEVVEKMRLLVERGQIAIQSFHYSDQLFIAHSRFSMEQSADFNRRAFARACLPLSKAVFTQEGQFSEGMLEMMKLAGQSVGIMKGGPFAYQYSDVPAKLLYTLRGQDVVTTSSISTDGFSVHWWFVDDGELAVTGEMNPYMGGYFKYSEKAANAIVEKLEKLQQDGWFLTTVEDYVRYLKDAGIKPWPLPYSLDLTWRPDDADNVFAWMGRAGLWGKDEADNEVLTSLERSRIALVAANVALQWGETVYGLGHLWPSWKKGVWHQALGEVSDSTGWNPWAGEVRYSLEHSRLAEGAAMEVLEAVRAATGKPYLLVHAGKNTVEALDFAPSPPQRVEAEPPFQVEVEAPGFDVVAEWKKFTEPQQPETFELLVRLTRIEPDAASVQISFPRPGNSLIYSPALLEEVQEIALDRLPGYEHRVVVPAANGLIGLGNGMFVLKDLRTIHLAAFFPKNEQRVYFRDITLNGPGPFDFRFLVLVGCTAEQALEAAIRLNELPDFVYP